MLTFEAEKHENIVAFVLFAVVPVWEIVCLGAEALSAGGHRSRFEAGVRRERGGGGGRCGERPIKGSRCGARPRACFAAASKPSWDPPRRERV